MNINKQIIDLRVKKIVEQYPDIFNHFKDENRKISNAFLYLIVSTYLDIGIDDAHTYIVDGANDAGIDAIYIGDLENAQFEVTVFQTKYIFDLEKDSNFPANSVQKVLDTIKNIFNPTASIFANENLLSMITEIRSLIMDGNIPNIKIVFSNNGLKWNEEGDNYIKNISENEQILPPIYFNHNDVVHLLKKFEPVNTKLNFYGISLKEDHNYKSVIVGKINVVELYNLFENFGDKLLEKNIRQYLGINKNRVNKAIKETLLSENRDNFYFYNNGVTMVCKKFQYNSFSPKDWIVNVEDLQIINGGQTCKTIQSTIKENKNLDYSQVFVLVRLYELSNDSNQELIDQVTLATNSQNPVDLRDLKSNDEIQKSLELEIKDLGYTYKRKKDSILIADSIPASVAAEAIFSIWREMPHLAKFKGNELFGKNYKLIFGTKEKIAINGAQLIIAVFIYRFCDNERRNIELIKNNRHIPYSKYFMAMLVGKYLLKNNNITINQLSNQNFSDIKMYFDMNKFTLYELANKEINSSLLKLLPDYNTVDLRRLSATFRRGDLIEELLK